MMQLPGRALEIVYLQLHVPQLHGIIFSGLQEEMVQILWHTAQMELLGLDLEVVYSLLDVIHLHGMVLYGLQEELEQIL